MNLYGDFRRSYVFDNTFGSENTLGISPNEITNSENALHKGCVLSWSQSVQNLPQWARGVAPALDPWQLQANHADHDQQLRKIFRKRQKILEHGSKTRRLWLLKVLRRTSKHHEDVHYTKVSKFPEKKEESNLGHPEPKSKCCQQPFK
jgi:hypothetical protein